MDERIEAERIAAAEQVAPQVLAMLEEWRHSGQALSRDTMAHRLRCSERIVRVAMAQLRLAGHLVVGQDQGGYRLARSPEEAEEFIRSMESRMVEIGRTVRAMKAALAREFPTDLQMRLEL